MQVSVASRLGNALIRLGLYVRHRAAAQTSERSPGHADETRRESDLSLVITTFEERFFEYCLPFVRSIRDAGCDLPITLVVNGPAGRSPSYRQRQAFLKEVADYPGVSPLLLSEFSGLSRLWNLGIQASGTEQVLCLNDDMLVTSCDFDAHIRALEESTREDPIALTVINGSWSSFVITKPVVETVGWFDERLVGIGEEDGDYTWRYVAATGRDPLTIEIPGLASFVSATADPGFSKHSGGKYSLANRVFIGLKYQPATSSEDGIEGLFGRPMKRVVQEVNPYPLSRFLREGPSILGLQSEEETRSRIASLIEATGDSGSRESSRHHPE